MYSDQTLSPVIESVASLFDFPSTLTDVHDVCVCVFVCVWQLLWFTVSRNWSLLLLLLLPPQSVVPSAEGLT